METSESIKSDYTARAICYEELGRVLLTLRSESSKFRSHCYDLPGGKSDISETPKITAARELAEETGLIVLADSLIDIFGKPLVHKFDDGRTRDVHFFAIKIKGILPKLSMSNEVSNYEWVHPQEAVYRLDQPVQYQAMKLAYNSNFFRRFAPRFSN